MADSAALRLFQATSVLFTLVWLVLDAWLLWVGYRHRDLSPHMKLVVVGLSGKFLTSVAGRLVPLLFGPFYSDSLTRVLLTYGIQSGLGSMFTILWIYGLSRVFFDVKHRLSQIEKPAPEVTLLD